MFITLIGVCFIPWRPASESLNNAQSVNFDEALLQRKIKEGNNVLLNVSEDFCISCLWNRFVIIQGMENQIKSGKLTIMRIEYDNPFLERLFVEKYFHSLPMNIVFSPKYPEGKIIDSNLKMWGVSEIAEDAFIFTKNEPVPQNQPEETAPKPEAKGLN